MAGIITHEYPDQRNNLMYPKPGHPEILQAPSFTKNSGLLWTAQRAPRIQKTTRLDRKMPQSGSRHPGFFQSSQATVLELWASPDLLGPPWTQLHTSSSHVETARKHRNQPTSIKSQKRGIPEEQLGTPDVSKTRPSRDSPSSFLH